jgi:cysteine desulfurase
MVKKPIYLDHGATTPVRPEVLAEMIPYWTEYYGNPSSAHQFGQAADRALEQARQSIADSIQCEPGEVVFTGCGSESDNLALRGAMWAARAKDKGNHLITCSVEHKAVLDTARQLESLFGFNVTVLPVDRTGQIDLDDLVAAIRPDTVLISIMAANNEIGTLQPIEAIGRLAQDHGVLFHTDAIQAAGVTHWDMRQTPIDLLSLAPHKFYGPKGIGILYVRRGIELISTLTGGGQENGRRAGTANVPFAVGAAAALRLAVAEVVDNVAHYQKLRDQLVDGVLTAFGDSCILTGHPNQRLPHNASFAFRDLSGNDLLMHLDMAGIAASSGSACLTGDPKPAAVLQAIGLADEWTKGGLRLTVGRQNTAEEVAHVLEILPDLVNRLRYLSRELA